MGFQVRLYRFQKSENSTKQPDVQNGGTVMGGNLRSKSGVLNPVIGFQFGGGGDSPSSSAPNIYNYAYIYQFGYRYYFIREWEYEAGIWWAYMEVDVLATWKSRIGASSLYILRSSHSNNGAITDTLYPAKTGCTFDTTSVTTPWTRSDAIYCVGVVTPDGGYSGSIAHYIMNVSQLGALCSYLMDSSNKGLTWSGVSANMLLSLADPIQYIKSCIMLPVTSVDYLYPHPLGINVFTWNTGVNALGGTTPASQASVSKTLSIIKHPDTSSRGNYVNSAPFTSLTLTIPPFGSIDIDTSVTCNQSSLTASVVIDPITGKGILTVTCGGIVLHRIEGQVGVPISLSQVTRDYIGAATGAAGAIGSVVNAAQGGFIGGAISGAASGIGNAIEAMMPRASTIGTTGSSVSLSGAWRLDHQFFRPVSDDNPHNGRPLCVKATLSSYPGYQLIQDGDVSIAGTLEEGRRIKQYLETGYYYE